MKIIPNYITNMLLPDAFSELINIAKYVINGNENEAVLATKRMIYFQSLKKQAELKKVRLRGK